MPTSLLKRILSRAVGQSPAPAPSPPKNSPQTICGTLAPGERIDIGPLRAANDGGYLAFRHLHNDAMLRWVFSGPQSEAAISNLGNRADEGVIFTRFCNDTWAFVAQVRPERCVVLRPIPERELAHAAPVCRFGPGGGFVHDWPGEEDRNAEHAKHAEEIAAADADDQAAGLRAAVAAANGGDRKMRTAERQLTIPRMFDGAAFVAGMKIFSAANAFRCETVFHAIDDWSEGDWMTAVAGEVGEAANLIKKRRRGEDILLSEVAAELADAVTYIDLLAARMRIDLAVAIRDKFNVVSKRRACDIRLT